MLTHFLARDFKFAGSFDIGVRIKFELPSVNNIRAASTGA
jgi:hypothetical protein